MNNKNTKLPINQPVDNNNNQKCSLINNFDIYKNDKNDKLQLIKLFNNNNPQTENYRTTVQAKRYSN